MMVYRPGHASVFDFEGKTAFRSPAEPPFFSCSNSSFAALPSLGSGVMVAHSAARAVPTRVCPYYPPVFYSITVIVTAFDLTVPSPSFFGTLRATWM